MRRHVVLVRVNGGPTSLTEIWKFEGYDKYLTFYPFQIEESLDVNSLLESLRNFSADLDIQMVNLDRIAGRKHLYFAVLNALHAFQRSTNISRTLAMEFLLYASAQKQILEAIKTMGVDKDTKNVVIIAIGKSEHSLMEFIERLTSVIRPKSDDTLLDRWSDDKAESLLLTFKISEKELQAMAGKRPQKETIQELIVERVALLATMT